MIKIVRLRLANVIRHWLTNHFHDYAQDNDLDFRLRARIGETFLFQENALGSSLIKLIYEQKQVRILSFSLSSSRLLLSSAFPRRISSSFRSSSPMQSTLLPL